MPWTGNLASGSHLGVDIGNRVDGSCWGDGWRWRALTHPGSQTGGLPAQAACAADCAAASAGLPLDGLFWCAGCQGGMYPLTGTVSAHVGGVQASLLAAERMVFRLHRLGLAWGTSGAAALCSPYPMPIIKKSQYRWQMSQPVPATAPLLGCNPTGRSSVLWESLRELPVSGENFGYLLWRKRNCCLW